MVGWLQFRGFDFEQQAYRDWAAPLPVEARTAEHPLSSLVPFLTAPLAPDELTQLETRQHRPRVDNARTRAALAEGGPSCPPLDTRLLTTWFDRQIDDGFLVRP